MAGGASFSSQSRGFLHIFMDMTLFLEPLFFVSRAFQLIPFFATRGILASPFIKGIFNYSGCQVHSFPLKAGLKAGFSLTASQAASSSGRVAFFILLDIVDESMNGSSYAQYATPQYLKTVQFLSVNLEPLNFEPE